MLLYLSVARMHHQVRVSAVVVLHQQVLVVVLVVEQVQSCWPYTCRKCRRHLGVGVVLLLRRADQA